MVNFRSALSAGISQTELAKALGVSRTTVNLWANGKMHPHRYNADNLRARLLLLSAAIEQGLIPGKKATRAARHEAIAAAMKAVANCATN